MAFKLYVFQFKTLITFIIFFSTFYSFPQKKSILESPIKVGFNYGFGTQEDLINIQENYFYESTSYKIQINFSLKKIKKRELALNIEPSFYNIQFQSYNNIEVEENMVEEINEYGVNFGIQTMFNISRNLNTYFLGSIGPTFCNNETVRLNRGFSFSDVIAIGLTYKNQGSIIDLRLSFRHVSNAGLNYPNRGYNSLNFEVGFNLPVRF